METVINKQTKNFGFTFIKVPLILLLYCTLIPQIAVFGQSNSNNNACIECHKKIVSKSTIHGPVSIDCTSCHTSNGVKHPQKNVEGFTLIKQGSELCYSCHKDTHTAITSNKYIHSVIKKKKDCLGCHEIHSSNNSKLVSSKTPALCLSCHKKLAKKLKKATVVHAQVTKEGGCLECHKPHSSKVKKLLVSNGKELCLTCHNKIVTTGTRKLANIGKMLKDAKVQHPALKKKCTSCHDPHASQVANFLKYPFPTGNYATPLPENYELCFNCHDSDLLVLKNTTTATEFRNGDQNLHYLHLNKVKGRTCINCHNVHASANDHLIPETVKFGNWNMPLKYVSLENGGSCASGCHKELKYQR